MALDYMFMYPLNMGISGAALYPALGPIFSVLILLLHFLCRRGALYFEACRPNFHDAGMILIRGFSSFIMEFSIRMVTFFITCYSYGELGLAAYLLIGYLMLIILTLFLGMAEGLQPVFSHFMTAGKWEENQTLQRFSTGAFLGAGLLCFGLILLFSRQFCTIFTPEDMELVRFASVQAPIYFWGFPLTRFNILMIFFWQSTRYTAKALAISLLRSVLLLPFLLLILPQVVELAVVWACHSIVETLTACCAVRMLVGNTYSHRPCCSGPHSDT